MAVRISNLAEVLGTKNKPFLLVVRNGYESLWQNKIKDSAGVGIDLSSATITVEVDFWMTTLVGTSITTFEQVAGSSKRSLTVTIDADQTANLGVWTLAVPSDLWTDSIPLDTTRLPLVVAYVTVTSGTETRTEVFAIAIRRGKATDG